MKGYIAIRLIFALEILKNIERKVNKYLKVKCERMPT